MAAISVEETKEKQAVKSESVSEVADKQNHYAEHLAEVNKNTDVISTEDIFNENGMLIAKSGTHINHSAANRIVQHKLVKSIEEQVQLENALNGKGLYKGLEALMEKYPDMKQINTVNGFNEAFEPMLSYARLHPVVFQELTVMSECLPEHYEKTLFCTWFSVLIATELGMKGDLLKDVMLAALAHDLGLLHISGNIIKQEKELTPEEWRAIQCHVVVGQIMLQKIDGKKSNAAKAVVEHHERCDGSGYPFGRTSEHLDVIGQIIGMADIITAIRINKFSKSGRNLSNILPCLKMNKYTHFLKVYNTVCAIMYKSGLEPVCVNPYGDTNALLSSLRTNGKRLREAAALLEKVIEYTESLCDVSECQRIMKVTRPVVIMISASGLVKKELLEWLDSLHEKVDESELKDLTDIDLLQNELHWQMQNVCKVIDDSLDKESESDNDNFTSEYKAHLESISGQINEILK